MSNYEPPAPPPPGGGGYGGGYGAPPPAGPPGGYGGPPQGGGYGAPPGGPGGYGQPPAPFSIGNAFNYGWTKFQANVGQIVLAVLAVFAVVLVMVLLMFVVSLADLGFFGFILTMLVLAVGIAAMFVAQVGIVRASLAITHGRPFTVQTIFDMSNVGQVLLMALIFAGVSLVTCGLGGIVVGFFGQFALYFIVDKNMGAIDAIKASFTLVNNNLATMIIFYLAAYAAYVVGAFLCGIGLLVAIPVVLIATAYTYRTLQGEQVAA